MTGTWALNLFDRLHIGHHILIDTLVDIPEPVAAVTSGELMSSELELAEIIQPASWRLEKLKEYLMQNEMEDIIQVESLSSYEELSAIQGDTDFLMFMGPCCKEIEEKLLELRSHELGLKDKFVSLKPVRAHDGEKMASARIRLGEIDREGRRLRGTKEPPRRLGESLRSDLATPKGDVYNVKDGPPEVRVVERIEREEPHLVIAVGDVTCATLLDQGYTPDVQIVDGITKRGVYDRTFSSELEYHIYNPAAVLYPEAWSVVDTAIHDENKSLIIVEGEEDLMGFPAVLLAQEGSVMVYGQPDVGIVWVPVTKENMKLARAFLEEMSIIMGE